MLGGFVSILIILLTLTMAAVKLIHLIDKHNPNITLYNVEHEGSPRLNLDKANFRIAYSLEDVYEPFSFRDDPDYVKWIFRKWMKVGGITKQRILESHKCTEEDYALFYPTEPTSSVHLEAIKADPTRGFWCLDWTENDSDSPASPEFRVGDVLGSAEVQSDYEALEAIVTPCNHVNREGGHTGDTIHETCNYDR